jgi:hypothetical protein
MKTTANRLSGAVITHRRTLGVGVQQRGGRVDERSLAEAVRWVTGLAEQWSVAEALSLRRLGAAWRYRHIAPPLRTLSPHSTVPMYNSERARRC